MTNSKQRELAEFLREERGTLIGYVRRRIDEAADQDAEDIVQDVIVSLFDRADPTVPIQNLAAFVYRSLRNRIIDRFRKRRETAELPEDLRDPGPDPLAETERQEALERMFSAMDGLSPDDKGILLATEFEGRSFKDLAEEWGVPLGTLLARKSRALDKIRKQLTGQSDHRKKELTP
ncbi:MAG: RNA polymerase sigma factor [Candidatus Aminicenantes bacterium]|nr:RNA polymerase sigma factor [Candidatus Aminicenantes bacterium]